MNTWNHWRIRIKNLNGSISSLKTSFFKDPKLLINTCLISMAIMLLYLPTRPLTILFVCASHIIRRLLNKRIGYWQLTWQPYIYTDNIYERGNPGQSSVCFVFLSYSAIDEHWIYRHSTGFLNYISVPIHSVILLCLANTPWNHFQIINIDYIIDQNQDSELQWH